MQVTKNKIKEIDDVYSCMWPEGEGRLGAIEIGSHLLYYFKKQAKLAGSGSVENIIYCDNCCDQQKNKFKICV